MYKYVPSYKFEIDDFDIDYFVSDPVAFYRSFGYYFVTGYTTGSSFEGILNYYSENKETLAEISRNSFNGYSDNFYSKTETKYSDFYFYKI